VDRRRDVMDDHVAWPREQRSHLLAVATIVRRAVVRAQRGLARPRGEQQEVTRILGRERSSKSTVRLSLPAPRAALGDRRSYGDE
jgi:hypothetical protein